MTLTLIAQILLLILGVTAAVTVITDKEQTRLSLTVNLVSIAGIVAILAGAPLLGLLMS